MNAISKTGRARKPIVVAMLSVIFLVGGTSFARSAAPALATAPQLNGEYPHARSGPCRSLPRATDRHRHWPCSPSAARKPMRRAITEFGPGSLRLQGTADSLRLEVRDSTIATVLAAMGRGFNVRYRSSTALDDPITGTYAGALTRVIARILDGYDYAITHEGPTVEIAVFGRSRGRAEPARPAPAMAAPVRRRRCGQSAGHQAACSRI